MWLQFRVGRGRSGKSLRHRRRHRNGWLRRLSFIGKFIGGHQTDTGANQPRRNNSDRAQPGHGWPNVSHRHRRGDPAERADGRRSARRRHQRQPGKGVDRLHEVSRSERFERRAAGHRKKIVWLQRRGRQVDERIDR